MLPLAAAGGSASASGGTRPPSAARSHFLEGGRGETVTLSPHSNAKQAVFKAKAWLEVTGLLRRPTLAGEPASWPKAGKTLPSNDMMPVPAPRTNSWQSLRRAAVGGLIVCLVSATTADAAGMIRDAETESLIKT